MRVVMPKFTDYLKTYRLQILLSALLTVISYVFLACSTNMRMDSDLMAKDPASAMLTTLHFGGRFGLAAFKYLLFLTTYAPVRSGLLFVLFMICCTQLLCMFFYRFSGGSRAFPYLVFSLLFGTAHLWAAQTYFIWQEAEIALALCLTSAVAGFMLQAFLFGTLRRRLVAAVLTLPMLVLCIGTYQSILVYYIVCLLMYFLLILHTQLAEDKESRIRRYLPGVLSILVHFAIAYLLYDVIAHTWFYTNEAYQSAYIQWGKLPFRQCVRGILYAVWHTLRFFDAYYTSFYPVAVVCAFYVIYRVLRGFLRTETKERLLLLAALCALMLTPFAFNVLFGAEHVSRIQFALQCVSAFVPAFAFFYLRERVSVRRLIFGAAMLFCALQISFNFRLLHTDNLRYTQDRDYAKEVLERIDACADPAKPVIFLGIRRMEQDAWSLKVSDFGYSYFEWGNTVDPPDANEGGATRFIRFHEDRMLNDAYTPEMLHEAVSKASSMGVFPDENGLLETEDYIIIKMSEFATGE